VRVLMLTNMYPHPADPSYGTFVFDQAEALRAAGVELEVLFVNGRATRWNYMLGYPRFWARIAQGRFDLVHSHYVFSGLIARAQFHLPVVQSFHAPGLLDTFQGWLCRRLMTRVSAVIVTSQDHKTRLGFAGARIIPCGVNLELFHPRAQHEARAKLGWAPDRKVLLWVGDVRKEKRVDLVHATYERLRPVRPDLDLRLVSGAQHADVPWFMNAADVLLFPSDHEGSPVVIKEAMACNLPIVATSVGDIPELFEGVSGCVAAPQSPEALGAEVLRLLDANARSEGYDAIRRLSTAREAESVVAIYEEVLAARRGRVSAATTANAAHAPSESSTNNRRGSS
jgi:glycosyltransferase involved in cell wall biosynthesis